MKVQVPAALAHYALRIALPLFLGYLPLMNIGDRHWYLTVASITAICITVLFGMLAYVHCYKAPCAKCRPKKPEDLKRWRYRVVIGVSRYAALPLATLGVLVMVLTPLFHGKSNHRHLHLDLVGDIPAAVSGIVYVLYLAAVRFDSANHPGRPRSRPVIAFLRNKGSRLVHRGHWIYIGFCALAAVLTFLPDHGVGGSVATVAVLLMAGSSFLNQQHGMTLCEDCATEFRTDAVEYAAGRRWRFTVVHKYIQPVYLAAIVVWAVIAFWHNEFWSNIGFVGYLLIGATGALFVRFHSQYQPWCPYCHGGGWGKDDEAPVDSPDPSQNHPVPA